MIDLRNGDCLEVLKELEDNSIDSIVTDPPYGISFMNKKWDYDVPSLEIWKECLRVLKPGGHLLSFGGSRTYHRMACAIEDAGFEIRDTIMWIYGSGFPKSLNIGKEVDKIQGNERKVLGTKSDFSLDGAKRNPNNHREVGKAAREIQHEYGYKQGWDAPVTKGNSEWEGWGTALKPAHEPIVMARKPIAEKTITENVLKWRTGGINIDGSRIGETGARNNGNKNGTQNSNSIGKYSAATKIDYNMGRFPANLIFDEEAAKILDEQSSAASRFFYCAKTSKSERNEGLEDFEARSDNSKGNGLNRICSRCGAKQLKPEECLCDVKEWIIPKRLNTHPTVKPMKLMSYLIKLVTPPNGIVLDPFMGSGTTGKAAIKEGFSFVGIEREKDYFEIAKARIDYEHNNRTNQTI